MKFQTIQEGKHFYLEARTFEQYKAGLTQYRSSRGRELELVVVAPCSPGVRVISRRKKK